MDKRAEKSLAVEWTNRLFEIGAEMIIRHLSRPSPLHGGWWEPMSRCEWFLRWKESKRAPQQKKEKRKQKHSPKISCDLPSMMASTAPPAQNSIRICSAGGQAKRGTWGHIPDSDSDSGSGSAPGYSWQHSIQNTLSSSQIIPIMHNTLCSNIWGCVMSSCILSSVVLLCCLVFNLMYRPC